MAHETEKKIVISHQSPDEIIVLGQGEEDPELTCPPVIRFRDETQMLNPVPLMRRIVVDGIDVYPRDDLTILPSDTPLEDLEELGLDLERQPVIHLFLPGAVAREASHRTGLSILRGGIAGDRLIEPGCFIGSSYRMEYGQDPNRRN